MMTKRRSALLIFLGAAVVLAVACRDSLAPSATSEKAPFASQPQLLRSIGTSSNLGGSIVLTPRGGDFLLGGFLLHVPAGAVCDPRTTNYGPAFWDDECTPLRSALRLQVQVQQQDGRLWIDFKPNVRFAPSSDASNWVTLTTWRPRGELASALNSNQMRQFALLYAKDVGVDPLDEGSIDRTMVTFVRMSDGFIWRRLKHFSGFTITLGRTCDTAADPTCTPTTGGDVEVVTNEVPSATPQVVSP